MADFSGHLSLRAAPRADGRTVLAEQSFRAPFHLSKPYWDPEKRTLLVQIVNPTAGILAGDRLQSHIVVDRDAALLVTTPSASRIFHMREGEAVSTQEFSVAGGAWLEVLPEPLVPHRGSRFRQITNVDVAPGGALFYVDQIMPGRLGHDEAWAWDQLRLELSVRLDGHLILRERMDQTGESLRALAEFGGSGATACFANAVLIAPAPANASPDWPARVHALHSAEFKIGVSSLRHGGWTLKCVAANPILLRDGLRQVRAILADSYQRLSVDLRKL